MSTLDGKIALVTGASRGIGKAIAIAYAREGAAVGCAARTVADTRATVMEIEKAGGRGLAIQADVTDQRSVEHMVEATVSEFGGLDILVANAGGNFDRSTVEEGATANWLSTLEVNLTGAYYSAKAAIPHLKRRGAGKIITVGSGMGHNGRVASSAYACSKAGLWMLTRVLAQELWRHNISVNELIPGPVSAAMTRDTRARQSDSVFAIESEWLKEPEDVAPLALFLATQPDTGPTAQSFSLMRRDG